MKGEVPLKSVETVRYKATIAYDGTEYSGFQVQDNGRTIQGEIETVLKRINKNQSIRIHPAGRTDAGVHAAGMVFHFDYPATISQEGLFKAMSVLLPDDISMIDLEQVEDSFHARYNAVAKTYTYRVHNHTIKNPFTRKYVLNHPYEMDEKKAKEALEFFIGTHDFTSFCSIKTVIENKVRTIYEATVSVDEVTNEWVFTFTGNGFLYNMIRIMMGTIIEISDGRMNVSELSKILEAKDREFAGKTIGANGLRLEKVYYDEAELSNRITSIETIKSLKQLK